MELQRCIHAARTAGAAAPDLGQLWLDIAVAQANAGPAPSTARKPERRRRAAAKTGNRKTARAGQAGKLRKTA